MNRPRIAIVGGGPSGMMLSSLLSGYGIFHSLIERRFQPTIHPQAHFMNIRSMEILQGCLPDVFGAMLHEIPAHGMWRDFVYCPTMLGNEFTRQNNFAKPHVDPFTFEASPVSVGHLAQNKFEVLMRSAIMDKENRSKYRQDFFGMELSSLTRTQTQEGGGEGGNGGKYSLELKKAASSTCSNTNTMNGERISLQCDYVIGADGANSLVRKFANIKLVGQANMSTIVNVHFVYPGLSEMLMKAAAAGQATGPAMLHFVMNDALVAIFVSHDPNKDEWVAQIPIFPPFQKLEDFDSKTAAHLLQSGIGEQIGAVGVSSDKLQILSINAWTMHAEVAEKFSIISSDTDNNSNTGNKNDPDPEGSGIILVGDSAHRFPPSGGFGMNSGLQDAHNLAWKLASVINGDSNVAILNSYDAERRPIAQLNTKLSVENFGRTLATTRCVGVDPNIVDKIVQSMNLFPIPFEAQRLIVNSALATGKKTLSSLSWASGKESFDPRIIALRRYVASGKSLPLIFSENDIGFVYRKGLGSDINHSSLDASPTVSPKYNYSDSAYVSGLSAGGRIPHAWISQDSNSTNEEIRVFSLTQLASLVNCATRSPLVTILISASNVDEWQSVLLSSSSNPSMIIPCAYSDSDQKFKHGTLQRLFQKPAPIVRTDDCIIERNLSLATEIMLDLYHDDSRACIFVHDTCGSVGTIMKGVDAIAIRPDGHVLAILKQSTDESSNSKESRRISFCKMIQTSLFHV